MSIAKYGYTSALIAVILLAPFAGGAQAAVMADDGATTSTATNDSQILTDINKQLSNKRFTGIKATVQNGILTLNGTTDLLEYKQEADKKAHRVKNVRAIRNQIEVAGKEISDQMLAQALAEKLEYDRVGYGNVFNAMKLSVQHGVVTLTGSARTPLDKDSAISLVSNSSGVKEVIDEVEVDPPSPMDDELRMAMARAVYGSPSLNKYAMDPARTIRIAVNRGNVELWGVVDSQADKNMANIVASTVPGAFKVTNNLVVANQVSGTKEKK